MTTEKAIEILKNHNAWRRDNNFRSELEMVNPKDLGKAIDKAIEEMGNKKNQELDYLLNVLNYGLNDCDDKNGNVERHFNSFANAINVVQDKLNNNENKKR